MNETDTSRPLTILSLLLGLLLTACTPAAEEAPPLQGAEIGGSFTLIGEDGRSISDRDFAGQYRLVYFGFTYCPDVCPIDLQLIGQALRQLEASDPEIAAKVQPLFISVDPVRDTPAVLREFTDAFHPRLIGLTGTPAQIEAVAKSHGVYFAKQEGGDAQNYLVDHNRTILLFGPQGEPIAIVPHERGADAIAAELKRWVK